MASTHMRTDGPIRRVMFNAPIRTGWRLDLQNVLADGYTSWLEQFEGRQTATWQAVTPSSGVDDLTFAASDYRGVGASAILARRTPDSSTPMWQDIAEALGPDLQLRNLRLEVFDFGIATLTAATDATGPLHDVRAIETLDAVLSRAANPHVTASLQRLEQLVSTGVDRQVWLRHDTESSRLHGDKEAGCLEWVHRLVVCDVWEDAGSCLEGSRTITFGPAGQYGLTAGHGTSVVTLGDDGSDPSASAGTVASVSDTLNLVNAYEAGSRELGGLVLKSQNQVAALRRQRKGEELERAAYEVLELYDQISLFRTTYREQFGLMSARQRMVASSYADIWGIDEMIHELECRGEDLSKVHDQALRRIQADDAERLNDLVTVLTFFSIAQVVAELAEFLNNDDAIFRVGNLGRLGLLFMTVLLVVAWFRARPRRFRLPRWARREDDEDGPAETSRTRRRRASLRGRSR